MIVLESWDELPAYLRRLADASMRSVGMANSTQKGIWHRAQSHAYMTLAEELEKGELKVRKCNSKNS